MNNNSYVAHTSYMIIMRKEWNMPTKKDYVIKGLAEEELLELADLFKMFADSTRIKILYVLFDGEKNVTDICTDIEMNQSAVSHQLKALKTAKLIKSRREGKSVLYSLSDDHVKTIIAMGKEHIEE